MAYRTFLFLIAYAFFAVSIFTGCNAVARTANDTESTSEHSFFGVWQLEQIAISVYHKGDLDLSAPPARMPIIEDFIGSELEITADFVRLGDRTLYSPEYHVSQPSTDWLFSSDEYIWEAEYYNSLDEFIEEMEKSNIAIGYANDNKDSTHITRVFASYPQYSEHWFQGWLLDPEADNGDYLFNPLFQNFILLNNDYMLVGGTSLILARRI
ncbi:MAG: hypothetical protein FWG87_07580 [Defluviitaleaceae bacterium]|nr:hypothetical protein [Defluviitaleaceae bacterium]